ncbi:D-inositol-3-phosphate glycosyltransferase [Friedmanniella endophytica]|uniref:D-inositol-3-phosphate glycosyltransferase n=1 Tax=Microlunatus kandeliicorticis TaxID=1759536 RepID=A0A7W3ISL3_9ACTN|nr:D-inositol-3-phosphate glycosyltransferase [Microlunatus kandeliicorticis]MBA8794433.1 D-inositol-3-phosphate glycosyltransferase [Microlunatus kandeliicorticis]
MQETDQVPDRVAMISMHTSPLDTPGVGDAGGLNVYVAELARRLGARGIAVDILTRRRDPDTPEVTEPTEGVRVLQVPAGPVGPVTKEELPELVDEFTAHAAPLVAGTDLVHSHYWLSGLAGLTLARGADVPLVHTMHTMARVKNAHRGADHLVEPDLRERGEAEIVRAADVLTANTRWEADELRTHYAAADQQIAVLPPGVDLVTFHPCQQEASRLRHSVDPSAQIVLFVGRLQPLKAPDVLIEAAAELIKRRPERRDHLRLIIIGSPSGPDSDFSETLSEAIRGHDLADVIIMRPHSPREELFRWYCVADVVGVPSYNESFGLVALEAQACGRPVVATDVGGLRSAVEDGRTGLLVDGHDPARWADALAAVLDDTGRAVEFGRRAARHAARFSWDNSAAAALDAYAQAVTRHAGR